MPLFLVFIEGGDFMSVADQSVPDNFVDVANNITRPYIGAPLKNSMGPFLEGRKTIVVVGAGYTGVSAALHLSADKKLRVILLDAQRIGQGPSGKSAGHVCGLQATDEEVVDFCGEQLGQKLISAAKDAIALVRQVIADHQIECAKRDGYIVIERDGKQSVTRAEGEFGITPYPYVVGLARAAQQAGVAIHEDTPVTAIETTADGCRVVTPKGGIDASYVVVAGGHRMAETIPALSHLRGKTTELKITTIVTPPLPDAVIGAIMPEGTGFPFSNDDANVAYGYVDSRNRIVFGSRATGFGAPNPRKIEQDLLALFPTLADEYRRVTGQVFHTYPYVVAEKLSFTRELLPYVGQAGEGGRILHIGALGGHGIALGTLLGKAAAAKVDDLMHGCNASDLVFDQFALIEHGRLPTWQPLRGLVAQVGLRMVQMARIAAARPEPT